MACSNNIVDAPPRQPPMDLQSAYGLVNGSNIDSKRQILDEILSRVELSTSLPFWEAFCCSLPHWKGAYFLSSLLSYSRSSVKAGWIVEHRILKLFNCLQVVRGSMACIFLILARSMSNSFFVYNESLRIFRKYTKSTFLKDLFWVCITWSLQRFLQIMHMIIDLFVLHNR